MAIANFFELFETSWAQAGTATGWEKEQYEIGWAVIGDQKPSAEQMNTTHQLIDQKTNWLFGQLKTAADEYNVTLSRQDLTGLKQILEKLYDPMPVGSTYTQYPDCPSPQELWGGTWEQLFANDAVFFRTEGVGAKAFGDGVQGDQNREHAHTGSTNMAGDHSHTGSTNTTGAHTHSRGSMNITGRIGTIGINGSISGAFYRDGQAGLLANEGEPEWQAGFDASRNWTGVTSSSGSHSHSLTTNTTGNHSHSVTINSSGGSEARPKNITVRVWKRTA